MNNATNKSPTGLPFGYQILSAAVYATISLLVIGGNLFCLIILKTSNYVKHSTKLFLTSLTIADLSIGLFNDFLRFLYFCLINTVSSLFLHYLCFVSSVAIVVFGGISILSLLLVNFDRYLAIEFPLKYPYFMTARRAGIAIAFSWTSAFGTSLLSLLLSIKHIFKKDSQYPACETLPRFNTGVVIGFSVGLISYFIIPFAITIAIYIRIIIIVKRH